MLHQSENLQVFAFRKGDGRFQRGRKRGSWPAYGIALRVRGRGRWRHVRVRLGWRGRSDQGRGIIQAEIDSWLTVRGTKDRVGGKTFVRFKAGRGSGPLA